MGQITAVAKLNHSEVKGDAGVYLAFNADYSDERNKEWTKYTPSMHLGMTVAPAVADKFELGETYLLTLEKL
ncbi:hypothetical protein PQB77_gp01 [Arthrobacter phage Correa]|uniref:Uncharacterized protein n=3 Tax=Mudcatvirus TaxID=1982088 RepID=A0A514A3Q9_9CAUD|nr:hypothetical protein PQB75_gp001 [Arthrobacter phage Tribby]YP_010666289.1 hypothetical protein PQB77_gp01 [Arthrobacter phage Correa]YP_010666385.1 hypothetical protein PQB78_gp01 [Arthrobacter phage Xenomorph]ASR80062.1 hypothetical protein SEA_CORREA_1 [Arthrobacter phage Correa]ASR80452.1 hypothetical protein SEA_TRIBBY_1 [Arthrobacter phage Tribby]QDH47914.1 hypothetical protein SEA_XENOMORPH_1 [Arthrobacter phage Xenomorph]